MTTQEAKRELAMLSSGTLGTLTGLRRYDEVDAVLETLRNRIDHIDVSDCKSWIDVYEKVKQGLKVNLWVKARQGNWPAKL